MIEKNVLAKKLLARSTETTFVIEKIEKCSWQEVVNKHVSKSLAQSVDKWTAPDTK